MERWLESFATTNLRRSSDTAHDLKTPLNVAVLNLELLRMRVGKVSENADDAKLAGYARAIEIELRRMAQIFDTFFTLSTPPKGEGDPATVDLGALSLETAAEAGIELTTEVRQGMVHAHTSRLRQCVRLFFDGASRLLTRNGGSAGVEQGPDFFELRMSGEPANPDFEPTKIFKLYYTDASGNADLALASSRLIAETYGGQLNASQDRDKVTLSLRFPTGE